MAVSDSGSGYISNCLAQQQNNNIIGEDATVVILPEKSIRQYTVQEQAEIASDFYIYITFQHVVPKLSSQEKLLKDKNGEIALLPIMERSEFNLTDEEDFEKIIDRAIKNERVNLLWWAMSTLQLQSFEGDIRGTNHYKASTKHTLICSRRWRHVSYQTRSYWAAGHYDPGCLADAGFCANNRWQLRPQNPGSRDGLPT
jgi:hypothetical protein